LGDQLAVVPTLGRFRSVSREGQDLRILNLDAELSGVPDGTFVSFESFRSGRARYDPNPEGFRQIRGSPDLVIAVVSKSSVEKDTEWLQKSYWEARIPEYWLVDARKVPLSFQILRHSRRGYSAVRRVQGWTRSPTLGHSFRFVEFTNGMGHPDYRLEYR
jgi:Uma2 family endonuclease